MIRALKLAKNGCGYTSPNPMVGCVIIKDGRIIGEGFHPQFGQKHAEVMAIENATEPVAGAEMYCNLEPCTATIPAKKTPPCVERIIDENIRKVYISTIDPNPHVNGRGIELMKGSGIEVVLGIEAEQALHLNKAYFKYIQSRLPFVHLKIAMSLDGRIATRAGDSKWITNREARTIVHRMRHQYDAVLVGLNTVKVDDPRLTLRMVEGRQPYRIVLDDHLTIPPHRNLLTDEYGEKTIIYTTVNHDAKAKTKLEQQGIKVKVVENTPQGKVDIKAVLDSLGKMGISSVLVEGGSQIFTEFIARQLFDEISFFIAPRIMGKGIEAFGDLGITKVSDALRLQNVKVNSVNGQLLVHGYRNLNDTFGQILREVECLPE